MTTIRTSRFGQLQVDERACVTLPSGIIGFPASTRYIVLDHFRPAPFKWLQSMDEPELAFAIMDPGDLPCEYAITVRDEDLRDLGRLDEGEFALFVIATVRSADPGGLTANLRGPVIVNLRTRVGKQVVLVEELPTRFPVFAHATASDAPVAQAAAPENCLR